MSNVAELSDEAFSQHVHQKAERHLNACFEAMDAYEGGYGKPTEDPAFAPFDGCNTCIVREVLMVCWDEMCERAKHEAERARST